MGTTLELLANAIACVIDAASLTPVKLPGPAAKQTKSVSANLKIPSSIKRQSLAKPLSVCDRSNDSLTDDIFPLSHKSQATIAGRSVNTEDCVHCKIIANG